MTLRALLSNTSPIRPALEEEARWFMSMGEADATLGMYMLHSWEEAKNQVLVLSAEVYQEVCDFLDANFSNISLELRNQVNRLDLKNHTCSLSLVPPTSGGRRAGFHYPYWADSALKRMEASLIVEGSAGRRRCSSPLDPVVQ